MLRYFISLFALLLSASFAGCTPLPCESCEQLVLQLSEHHPIRKMNPAPDRSLVQICQIDPEAFGTLVHHAID